MTTAALGPRPLARHLTSHRSHSAGAAALIVICAAVIGASVVVNALMPLAVATIVVFLLVASQRPVVAGAVVIGVVPTLSGVQRGQLGPLKPAETLLLLAAVAVLLQPRPWGQRLRAADLGLIGFAVLGAVFGLVHALTGDSSVSSFLRFGLQPSLLYVTFWVASRAIRDEGDLRVALRTALVASVIPAALAVGQAVNVPGLRPLLARTTHSGLLSKSVAAGLTRATGPFPIWHSLAAYLLVVLVLAVALLLRAEQDVLPRPLLGMVATLLATALVLSLTLVAFAWGVVAVLVLAATRGQLVRAVALLAVTAGLTGVLFSGLITARLHQQSTTSVVAVHDTRTTLLPQTISYRITVWRRDYVPLLERAVPIGIGNELPASALFQHAENQYIVLLLRGGVLLLLGAIAALVLVGRDLRILSARAGPAGAAAAAGFGVLVFLPVAAMLWPYLSNAGLPQALLSLAGAAIGAAGLHREAR